MDQQDLSSFADGELGRTKKKKLQLPSVSLASFADEELKNEKKGGDGFGLVHSVLSGVQGATAGTLQALLKYADAITDKLGIKKSDFTRIIAQQLAEKSESNRGMGAPGIVGKVASGLGQAAVDIPSIMAMGPLGLPVHGAVMGGAEGGVGGALKGAAIGTVMHGGLKALGGLRAPSRIAGNAAVGAAMTPGGLEDRVAGAITMGTLGAVGGRRKPVELERGVPVSKIKVAPVEPPAGVSLDEVARVRDVVKKTPSRISEAIDTVKGIVHKPGKIVHKAAFEMVDRYDPVARIENVLVEKLRKHQGEGVALTPEALEIAEKGIPFDKSTYNMFQLRGGSGGDVQIAREDLQVALRRVESTPQEFTDYMVALKMMERAGRGISNPGGLTFEDAFNAYQKIVSSIGPENAKRFHQSAQMYTQWANHNIIRRLVESDMMSMKDARAIMESNKHPIPFQKFTSKEDIARFINDISFENAKDGESYANVVGKKIFAQEGMAKYAKIQDPWEAVMERLGAVIGVSERNKGFANFVRLMALDPETRRMVRRVKQDAKLPPSYGSFQVWIKGKSHRYSAPIDVIESFKTMQSRDIGFISGLMGKTKNAFVVGTTGLNLPFGLIKNPIRDLWTVGITSKYGFGPKAYVSGLVNSLAANFGLPTRLYYDYLKSHAAFGGFLNRNPVSQAKDLFKGAPRDKAFHIARQVINPISLFKGLSKSIEMAPRMGQFKKNIEGIRAQSPEMTEPQVMMKAALLARRSTVDFHRAGNFVKTMNYYVPFLNARVQSVMNTFEALTSNKGIRAGKSSIFGIKGDSRAVAAARVATFVVTPALAAYFYNRLHHSEDYDKVPQDTKDRYIVIMTGASSADPDTGQVKPEAILIPKTDAHQMFWNPTESMLDWAWANKPQDISAVATNFFSNISPVQFEKEGKFSLSRSIAGVVPPALQAPLAIATNKDLYWDRPLVPRRLEGVAPEEQYTNYTPELYKSVGKTLGVSPIKTQKVAESFLGGVARTPTPASIGKGLKETVHRRVGKEFSGDIYEIDQQATSGYETARIRAERLIKSGDKESALKVLREWNKKSVEYVDKMAKESGNKAGYVRQQPWFKQIYFSPQDVMNLIKRAKQTKPTGLKRELNLR